MEEVKELTEYQKTHKITDLLEKNKEKMDKLRAQFKGREDNDLILYRFLSGLGFDEKEAANRIENNLKWRVESKFDDIVAKYCREDVPQEDLPYGKEINRWWPHREDYCRDVDGNPVCITRIGIVDPNGLFANVTLEQMQEYMLILGLRLIINNDVLSKKTGILVKSTRIIDLGGFGSQHLVQKLLDYLKSGLGLDFPENMIKCYVINTPSIFYMGWKFIEPLLDRRLLAKVSILGTDFASEMKSRIPLEHLPVEMGGKNTKTCTIDYEKTYTKRTVSAGSEEQTHLPVESADAVLTYDLRVLAHDIRFKIDFVPGSSAKADPIRLMDLTTVAMTDKNASGEIPLPGPGKVVFTLDNRHASWYSKSVVYKVALKS